jgi:hypothetical protein
MIPHTSRNVEAKRSRAHVQGLVLQAVRELHYCFIKGSVAGLFLVPELA